MSGNFDKWVLQQTLQGNVYHCATTGSVTLSTASTVTNTGLALDNPSTSGKNLVLLHFAFAIEDTADGPGVVGLLISPKLESGLVTHTTPAVIHNGLTSGSNLNVGVAKVDVSATLLTAPVWFQTLGSVIDDTVTESLAEMRIEPRGSIVLPPGSNLSLAYLTTAFVGIASCSWVEVETNFQG